MTALDNTARSETAATRAIGYGFLAHLFAYPSEQLVRALREIAQVTSRVCGGTPVAPLAQAVESVSEEELRRRYVEAFTHTTNPDCPTYETAYLCRDTFQQAQRMAELCGFYRAWGVQTQRNGSRPDDVGAELEFMGLLAAKEWLAIEEGNREREQLACEAQELFLREHLGRWAPAFARRLVATAGPRSVYGLAGAALQTWLADEAARFGVDLGNATDEVTVELLAAEPHGDITPPVVTLDTIEVMDR